MNNPEITPNPSAATIEYAALLKKAAEHLAYIANHRLVTDLSLISEKVQHVRNISAEELAKELEQEPNVHVVDRYIEL